MTNTVMNPIDVVRTLVYRASAGDLTDMDDLVAEDLVNHAAGPQGRDGWKATLAVIDADLGPITVETHHLLADGDIVTHHMTLRGTHRGSTMPLLRGLRPSGRPVAWRYIHLWRVAHGQIVEHWACRDDRGLLSQITDPCITA